MKLRTVKTQTQVQEGQKKKNTLSTLRGILEGRNITPNSPALEMKIKIPFA